MLTNDLNLPQPFVDAAKSSYAYKPHRYSVTEVLGGTCEAVLKRRHHGEQDEDVADRVWAIFGTAVHKVLEQAEPKPWQKREHWMCVLVDNYELSGICDLYDEETETVTDWKTTSVWSFMFKDYEAWRKQLAIYCWMLIRKGYKCKRGEVVAIMRDHSMRKARTEADYPKHPVAKLSWEFTAKDIEAVEREVYEWFAEVKHQEQMSDGELLPCSPKQRWAKPETWAVKKAGRKRASRVFEDKEEAVEYLNRLKETDKGVHLERRFGEDTRCESYCPVSQFCQHMRAKDTDIPF